MNKYYFPRKLCCKILVKDVAIGQCPDICHVKVRRKPLCSNKQGNWCIMEASEFSFFKCSDKLRKLLHYFGVLGFWQITKPRHCSQKLLFSMSFFIIHLTEGCGVSSNTGFPALGGRAKNGVPFSPCQNFMIFFFLTPISFQSLLWP